MKVSANLLLAVTGSMALVACGDGLLTPGVEAGLPPMVEGGPCLVEGQQSECAKDGYPSACGACQGHWLLCQSGKWIPIHCDPPPLPDPSPDAAMDARDAADVPANLDSRDAMDTRPGDGRDSPASEAGGSTSVPLEGEPCAVEGQQSECAKFGYPSACASCQGHWLLCQSGKWIPIHCDPLPIVDPSLDAAIDARDAADGPQVVDGLGPVDTAPYD